MQYERNRAQRAVRAGKTVAAEPRRHCKAIAYERDCPWHVQCRTRTGCDGRNLRFNLRPALFGEPHPAVPLQQWRSRTTTPQQQARSTLTDTPTMSASFRGLSWEEAQTLARFDVQTHMQVEAPRAQSPSRALAGFRMPLPLPRLARMLFLIPSPRGGLRA